VNMDMCMRHAPCDTLCMCMHMHMLMHMHTHAHAHVHVVACLPVRADLLPERERVSLCCRASEKVRPTRWLNTSSAGNSAPLF
jgi:hypothetical protein